MRKLLSILIVLSAQLVARGQGNGYVQVTGTKACYANGSVNAAFVNLSGGNQLPLLSGSVFPTTATTNFDSSGAMSFFLADNNLVVPSPSQWTITACAKSGGQPACGTTSVTVTGTTPQDISSQMANFPCGGSGGAVPGSQYDILFNNGGSLGANPAIRTSANGDVISSGQLTSALPRVNVMLSDFAGGADNTGVRDSLPAINAAILFSANHPQGNGYPQIYLPAGTYSISNTIRIPAQMHLVGDGPLATIIEPTCNTCNAITVTNVWPAGAPPNLTPNVWAYYGSLENLAVHVPSGHLYTATILELQNAVGYTIFRFRGSNGGGRGLVTLGSTERLQVIDTYWDTIRWPIIALGNEQRFLNTNIASPGETSDGYCFGINCVNGVFPSATWTGARQTLVSSTGNGTTATFVANCVYPVVTPPAPSCPVQTYIAVGQRFSVMGSTALDGPYTAATVTYNQPTAGQFTVTAASTVTGTGTANAGSVGVQQVVSSVVANGSTVVVVVNGGSDTLGSNGVSPLVIGHWFNLSNISNIPGLNGFYKITNVQNNSGPGQYTLTAASTQTGTAQGAIFKPSILPDTRGAFFFGGASTIVTGGSIKALWYAPCFQVPGSFSGVIDSFYCEGYPINGQPHLGASVIAGGLPWWTTLTSAVVNNVASVASTEWAQTYVNDPNDFSVGGSFVHILPADFLVGSTAPSAAVPGIQRGQYEGVLGDFAGDGTFHLRYRNQGGTAGALNWPAGSVVAEISSASYGTLLVKSSHFEGVVPPGPSWEGYCVDGTSLTCATAITGPIPNEYTTFTMGELKGGGGGATVAFENDEWWGTYSETTSPGHELYGQEFIKGFGDSRVRISNGYPGPRWADTTAVANGQFLANQYPVIMAVQYPSDGSFAWMNVSYPDVKMSASQTTSFYESMINGTVADPNIGPNPGSGFSKGLQFYGSHCGFDMGTPASPHVLNRWCMKGAPESTTANQGWEWDTWNGTAWVNAFSVSPAGIGGNAGTTIAQLAGANNFTNTNTFPDIHSAGATIGGVVIGNLSNLAAFSNNFAVGTTPPNWGSAGAGPPTFVTGQPDPWGTNTATQWTTPAGQAEYIMRYSQSAVFPAGVYNVCIWAHGANGGETFLLVLPSSNAAVPVTLTTSYTYNCAQVTATAAFGDAWELESQSSQTFTVACISTTVAGNATGCLITGATNSPTPKAMVAIGPNELTLSAPAPP